VTGSELRRLRRSVRGSQAGIAKLVGISQAALSQAETGRTKLTREHEARLREKIALILKASSSASR
jgi:transcriptional regulator with XRE-family HTH domain